MLENFEKNTNDKSYDTKVNVSESTSQMKAVEICSLTEDKDGYVTILFPEYIKEEDKKSLFVVMREQLSSSFESASGIISETSSYFPSEDFIVEISCLRVEDGTFHTFVRFGSSVNVKVTTKTALLRALHVLRMAEFQMTE